MSSKAFVLTRHPGAECRDRGDNWFRIVDGNQSLGAGANQMLAWRDAQRKVGRQIGLDRARDEVKALAARVAADPALAAQVIVYAESLRTAVAALAAILDIAPPVAQKIAPFSFGGSTYDVIKIAAGQADALLTLGETKP